jgi:hypothetical protein
MHIWSAGWEHEERRLLPEQWSYKSKRVAGRGAGDPSPERLRALMEEVGQHMTFYPPNPDTLGLAPPQGTKYTLAT